LLQKKKQELQNCKMITLYVGRKFYKMSESQFWKRDQDFYEKIKDKVEKFIIDNQFTKKSESFLIGVLPEQWWFKKAVFDFDKDFAEKNNLDVFSQY